MNRGSRERPPQFRIQVALRDGDEAGAPIGEVSRECGSYTEAIEQALKSLGVLASPPAAMTRMVTVMVADREADAEPSRWCTPAEAVDNLRRALAAEREEPR